MTAPPAVAIVGGGPVGLVLALFLDRHGVPSVVFDAADGAGRYPRGNTHNARTMEHYRSLGIADDVRALGLPAEHPTDVAYFAHYTGPEMARIAMPSTEQKRREVHAAGPTDQVPEPLHRANQMYVERFLLRYARTRANIRVAFGEPVVSVDQDRDGVDVHTAAGRTRVRFAVGCDGGQGLVRRTLGISYGGHGPLGDGILSGRAVAAHLRLPTAGRDCFGGRRAWSAWAVNADVATNLIALDGREEFFLLAGSVTGADVNAGLASLVRLAAGVDIPVEVLGHRPWAAGTALVADRFGAGRVFLAGDAAHLFTPTGGFGMNTGVDDAANLAWKLAAVVGGWAPASLLRTYESERRPVALRNTGFARSLNQNLAGVDRPRELGEDSARGARARARLGATLATFGEQFASVGVQLGARYDGSAAVVHGRGDEPPPDSAVEYHPSGVPGGRAPHLWCGPAGPRSSLYDRFLGTGFSVLRLRPDAPGDRLAGAGSDAGIPVRVVDVPHGVEDGARELYGRDLVIVRPDGHIGWRGDTVPGDPRALWARLVGSAA